MLNKIILLETASLVLNQTMCAQLSKGIRGTTITATIDQETAYSFAPTMYNIATTSKYIREPKDSLKASPSVFVS